MERYIAFLRGINISGKDKVPMAELRQGFEQLGFTEVKTCLNSGNVSFSSEEKDTVKLTSRIQEMIQSQFNLKIPVFMITKQKLEDILRHAPRWWERETRKFMITLFLSCRLRLLRMSITRSGNPKKDWSRYRNMNKLYSGPSAGKSIRKQTGGQRRQTLILAAN